MMFDNCLVQLIAHRMNVPTMLRRTPSDPFPFKEKGIVLSVATFEVAAQWSAIAASSS